MKSHPSLIKQILWKIAVIFLGANLLLACGTASETPQGPIAKPTKTKTFPATKTSENSNSAVKTFSIQDANKVLPDDIIQEVYFGGQGGGDPCDLGFPYAQPVLGRSYYDINLEEAEWLQSFNVVACGWEDGESVILTVSFPDGTTSTEHLVAELSPDAQVGAVWTDHIPSIEDLVGEYTFLFEGNSGKLEHTVNVYVPSEPRLYALYNKDYDVLGFYLYGFAPHERVRLFLYSSTGTKGKTAFTAWDEFYVDEKGQLRINTNDRGGFFAIGDLSGMNQNSEVDILLEQSPTSSDASSCAGALPSRLKIGGYAYVATDPPLDQRIREGAGKSFSIVGYIAPGNPMKILDGPKCADSWTWWKVQSIKKTDLIGWTAEGDDVYWLVPCKSLDSCP